MAPPSLRSRWLPSASSLGCALCRTLLPLALLQPGGPCRQGRRGGSRRPTHRWQPSLGSCGLQ